MKSLLKSVSNLRDLATAKSNNVKIKSGLLYRSAHLNKLSDNDLIKFNNLHINKIYDLRFYYESDEKPDRNTNTVVQRIPFFKHSNTLTKEYVMEHLKHADESFFNLMLENFRELYTSIFDNKALKMIFDSLNKHETILFHCSGGKDRTGVTAILIELALGFSADECRKDYLATKKYRRDAEFKYFLFSLFKGYTRWGNKVLNLFYTDPQESLFDLCINTLFNKYNSIEEFLLKEYKITQEMIDDWKEFYLEK